MRRKMNLLRADWYIRTSREALGLCIVLEVIFIELITEAVVIGYVDCEWRVWKGFPSGLDSKESAVQETQVQSWIRKIPWRREWLLTLLFLLGEFHRQRSLAGYSTWGRKELDMSEWVTHTHTHTHTECGKKGALQRHLSWRRDRHREGRSVSELMTKYWGMDHFKG